MVTMFFFWASVARAADGDFVLTELVCAKDGPAALAVDTESIRWPFKATATKLALAVKVQDDAHKLACSRIQVEAVNTAFQDTTAFAVASTAVEQGRTVSLDARSGQVATGGAAVMRELPQMAVLGRGPGYGGYGSGYSADAKVGWNLGFLEGQQVARGIKDGRRVEEDAVSDTEIEAADTEIEAALEAAFKAGGS